MILAKRCRWEEVLGQAWNVPNTPALTQQELITLLFQEIGLPVKTRQMGKLRVAFGGLFLPGAREMVEMMYEFEKSFVVDASKLFRAFGDIATPHSFLTLPIEYVKEPEKDQGSSVESVQTCQVFENLAGLAHTFHT